ncbi:TIGR02234 family membrane protein [Corynebacterium frankenforstense]|uniref:TIGR02234 family membrane protein n=1 Tax=Corynebacterium frankenforstense TaxID=1230998 RepID=UPI0026F32D9A|nr:TIGR02234 family membrane protein [Corynebacterium frankenforstense]
MPKEISDAARDDVAGTADATAAGVAEKKTAHRGALGVALGGLIVWLGSRLTWVSVDSFDDKLGETHHDIVGGSWATELTVAALLLVAAAAGSFVLRRVGRRVVGAITALIAAAVAWIPLSLLLTGPDPDRVFGLLTSGADSQRADGPVALNSWAELTDVQLDALGPSIALIGAALALLVSVLIVVRPGTDAPRRTRFARGDQRRARVTRDLEEDPESGRVLWDALDADIDPTDR